MLKHDIHKPRKRVRQRVDVQAPWLELQDGRILTQSLAINLYCAQLTGYLPSNQLLVARTVELDNCIGDVRPLCL